MALSPKDIRLTVRHDREGGTLIYPRLLRDRSALPRLQIATDYFESMVGKERREMDGEILVNFFGDHKLARCVVGALSRTYQYRRRRIADVASKTSARRLTRAGLTTPVHLRLALYDRLNTTCDGFVADAERPGAYADLEQQLRLREGEFGTLLYLDAEEHAILCRAGERASPEDTAAQFNLLSLEALLRQAERLTLRLADPDRADDVAAVARGNGVALTRLPERSALVLHGQQDALGNWSRHGRRLARTCIGLLERDRSAFSEVTASLALPNRPATLRLTSELLDLLAGAAPAAGWEEAGGALAERTAAVALALRRLGAVRRWPDPQAWRGGTVLPDLRLGRGDGGVLVILVRGEQHARRLATIAPAASSGEPLLFVGEEPDLAPLSAAGARVIATAACTADGVSTLLAA